MAAATIYQCPECDERMPDRRCPDCNLFTRRVGPGGPCPHCDELILLTELAEDDQLSAPTYTETLTSSGSLAHLARWPSRQALRHARDRIRFLTMRTRLAAPTEQVVQEVNIFLRGWAGYFRYGNSSYTFNKIRSYALMRIALFIAKRHQRSRAWGFAQAYRARDTLGLISLNGIVVAPRPNRPWRAPVEHRR